MNGEDGIVIDDTGKVYYSDPEQVAWIKKMEEATKKARKLYGSEDDEDEVS